MRALVMDNGIFRLSILPEFGGRLCSLFYRPLNLELLSSEFLHGPRNTMNVHGGWCAAFPSLLADGEQLTHMAWEAQILEQCAERVTVSLHCHIDQVSHTLDNKLRVTPGTILVERQIRLCAGEAAITVEDILTNRNVWPMPCTWSLMIALRAHAGDHVILPVQQVEVQRGVGPSGNELDFGLLVSTPYQALARNLSEGWVGFRPALAPIDLRVLFPKSLLPHAVIAAQRNENHPAEGSFRLQPLATPAPIADDSRGGALILPPKVPVHIPIRLEAGDGMISVGEWSRPGLQLAEMIMEQQAPTNRLIIWRIGARAIALKSPRQLIMLMPETGEDGLLTPDDLPSVNLILYDVAPPREALRRQSQRTAARFLGPSSIRQMLLTDGIGDDRAISLSPGARVDLTGCGVLATPSRDDRTKEEKLGYLVQSDNLTLYHTGVTQFLGEFGIIGEQFHPQLVFLPLECGMSMADCVHAARQLQPRVVVPLGSEEAEADFIQRCRQLHLSFATQALSIAEGRLFDGWHLQPLTT
jgi:L-ascorbate metabolism protein UlaG (beta-lactamase superfamily)